MTGIDSIKMLIRAKTPERKKAYFAGLVAPLVAPLISIIATVFLEMRDDPLFLSKQTFSQVIENLAGFSIITLPYAYAITWLIGLPVCRLLAKYDLTGVLPVVGVGASIGLIMFLLFSGGYDGGLMLLCSVSVAGTAWVIANWNNLRRTQIDSSLPA